MDQKDEQEIVKELIIYFHGLFKEFPTLKLSADTNMSFTYVSSVPEDYRKFKFDILIQKNDRPFIIVDIRNNEYLSTARENTIISFAGEVLEITKSSYFIFTDGDNFKLIDGTDYLRLSVILKNDLKDLFLKSPEITAIQKNIDLLYDTIKDGFQKIDKYQKWVSFAGSSKPNDMFEYNKDTNVYLFKGNPFNLESFENKFFRNLIPEFADAFVYRYTTAYSLESMMKFNTFRMSGIVGMNDPTEVDYVDDYIYRRRKPLDEWPKDEIKNINRVFISSCSSKEKEDDLTLWRLYGDDSKGVSLKLNIRNNCINHNMLLGRVSYGKPSGHQELDVVKSLGKDFKDTTSSIFEFKTYETWKHFFKPYQYEVEMEVRLLYVNNDQTKPNNNDWVVTYGDKIFNPVVDFKLNALDFPLKLVEITLGPNTPERNVNKAQLEEYIRQLKEKKEKDSTGNDTTVSKYLIEDLTVKLSNINNYRKS